MSSQTPSGSPANLPPHFEALMVKVVDDAATPLEREELMDWLADKPRLRRELQEHQALKAVTDGWVARLELDLAQDAHARQGLGRVESSLGLGLLFGGLGLVAGWGVVDAVMDPATPGPVRLGTLIAIAGAAVLLLAVIRRRLHTRKHDRYTEVIR